MPLQWMGAVALLFLSSCQIDLPRSESLEKNPFEMDLKSTQCALWYDEAKIPHLKAENDARAYACMGYIHGRDRAWQMDYLRRVSQGRTAEIFGYTSIKSDFTLRTLGISRLATRIYNSMSQENQKMLWFYTHGVNKGFEINQDYEFKDFSYRPEKWHPIDSVALVLLQSFNQTRKAAGQDMQEEEWSKLRGQKAAALFSPDGLPWDVTILKKGEYPTRATAVKGKESEERQVGKERGGSAALVDSTAFPYQPRPNEGSNNWVVSPKRSKSGRAWLANDPHLDLVHPPFWHWSHVQGQETDVIGAALPGVPGIVSGANRHVAWGLTNSYMDVADTAIVDEKEVEGAEKHFPLIWVKAWKLQLPFIFKSYRITRLGLPVVPMPAPEGKALVFRWSGFHLDADDFNGLFRLISVKNAREADQTLSAIGIPSWNFVFADTEGNIGYRVVGKIPKSESGRPFGMLKGRLDELKQEAFLSPKEMPSALNPSRGYLATANNRQWPADSLYDAGRAQSASFRAYRIEELLLKEKKHDLASMSAIQCDHQAVDARFLLPLLMKNMESAELSEKEAQAVELLKRWELQAGPDCKACGIYRRWVDLMQESENVNEAGLYRLLQDRASAEELRESISTSFQTALADLGDSIPRWSQIHKLSPQHLSGQEMYQHAKPLYATSGDAHSVDPGTAYWDGQNYVHHSGASHRLIVEMTSPPQVYSVLAGPNQDDRSSQKEWQDWSSCQISKRRFPLDWSTVADQIQVISL